MSSSVSCLSPSRPFSRAISKFADNPSAPFLIMLSADLKMYVPAPLSKTLPFLRLSIFSSSHRKGSGRLMMVLYALLTVSLNLFSFLSPL